MRVHPNFKDHCNPTSTQTWRLVLAEHNVRKLGVPLEWPDYYLLSVVCFGSLLRAFDIYLLSKLTAYMTFFWNTASSQVIQCNPRVIKGITSISVKKKHFFFMGFLYLQQPHTCERIIKKKKLRVVCGDDFFPFISQMPVAMPATDRGLASIDTQWSYMKTGIEGADNKL